MAINDTASMLSVVAVTNPANSTVILNASGTVTYTARPELELKGQPLSSDDR